MNNRIKKLLSLTMAGAMVLSLAACSNSDTNTDNTDPDTNNTDPDTNNTDNNTTSGDTIKVGALFNITGGQASLDEPGHRAFELYFDELNKAGGINGRQIEVVSYDDLVEAGSMAAAKAAGKVRMEGKDYVMQD
ncbi:MAG: DUF933 domain-containing protein, partial [Clostridiales bacterium]|nr:DUF933 domain-containing protein [Clostridiales bacterium]